MNRENVQGMNQHRDEQQKCKLQVEKHANQFLKRQK